MADVAPLTVAVAATFTAEPLAGPLEFWLAELEQPANLVFAPYGQVFPALLDPGSALSANSRGVNLLLVRFEDWAEGAGVEPGGPSVVTAVTDFAAALRTSVARTGVPHLVVVGPPSPGGVGAGEAHHDLEAGLVAALAGEALIDVTTSRTLVELYGADRYDDYADRIGRMPYTAEFYASLATMAARRLAARLRVAPKVLVLDCDGTLWDGVVGEDGPDGVQAGRARRAVRTLLADQVAQGRLLCLASNNDERDVHEVFARHPDWPLTLEQVTAGRIDWTPKSQKLRSMATQLGLGLDSFVLIDDDPVQCGEVRAACPEVLTVQLPADPEAALAVLRHCWPLDPRPLTSADGERSRYYREAGEREQHRAQLSHADFIASLDLVVSIGAVRPHELERVRQLSERTNQFNLTGARAPGGPAPSGEILTVQVRDRFGDYGLVGAVALRTGPEALSVEMFLLSCRALARGVEHRIAAHIGELAVARGLDSVALNHRATGRNHPALAFLATLPGQENPTDASRFVIPAAALAAVRHDPGAGPATPGPHTGSPIAADPAPPTVLPAPRPGTAGPPAYSWAWVARVATELASPAAVLAGGRAFARRNAPAASGVTTDRAPTATELSVMRMWADLLGFEPGSITDSLLDLGGNSLLLVQFMARVHADLRVELPIDILFMSAFTVEQVAQEIDIRLLGGATDDELAGVLRELDGLSDAEIDALFAGDGV